jgi:hypothetical protein
MGKGLKGTDFKGVAADIDRLIDAQARNAAAVDAAADLNDALSMTYREMQYATLKAIQPIAEFVKALDPQTIQNFAESIVSLAQAFVALYALNSISKLFTTFGAAVTAAGSAGNGMATYIAKIAGSVTGATGPMAGLTSGISNLFRNIVDGHYRAAASAGDFNAIGSSLARNVGRMIGGLAGLIGVAGKVYFAFEALNAVLKVLVGFDLAAWIDKTAQSAANFLGIAYKTSAEKEKEAAATKAAAAAEEKKKEAAQRNRDIVNAGLAQEQKLVNDALSAYQSQSDELRNKFNLQTRVLGMSEEQKLVEEENASAQERMLKGIEPLRKRILEIQGKGKDATEAELALIPTLQSGIQSITAAYAKGEPARQKDVDDRVKAMLAVKEMAYWSEQMIAADERRKGTGEQINNIFTEGSAEIKRIWDEYNDSTLTETERKVKAVGTKFDEMKKKAYAAQAALYSNADGDIVDPEGFAKALDNIDKLNAKLKGDGQNAVRATSQAQRSFKDGWKNAYKTYADDATNAAKTAENIFKKATQGIEDAIVGLAKTGKFEWKSMLSSIAEEILRSGIRKSLTGLFEGLNAGGDSILGKVGKMFGLEGMFGGSAGAGGQGSSANNPLYTYMTNGGAMGGMTGGGGGGGAQQNGGGGWWDSVTETVSNVWDGITGAASSVWDTVTGAVGDLFGGGGGSSWLSDLAGGVASFFGGFFADGGSLGAGKWGIAGENGPEMISGPATITPMGGGSSNVTYNINAVDAASFKSMIAADPSFIHAVAQQGGRSVPRRY